MNEWFLMAWRAPSRNPDVFKKQWNLWSVKWSYQWYPKVASYDSHWFQSLDFCIWITKPFCCLSVATGYEADDFGFSRLRDRKTTHWPRTWIVLSEANLLNTIWDGHVSFNRPKIKVFFNFNPDIVIMKRDFLLWTWLVRSFSITDFGPAKVTHWNTFGWFFSLQRSQPERAERSRIAVFLASGSKRGEISALLFWQYKMVSIASSKISKYFNTQLIQYTCLEF